MNTAEKLIQDRIDDIKNEIDGDVQEMADILHDAVQNLIDSDDFEDFVDNYHNVKSQLWKASLAIAIDDAIQGRARILERQRRSSLIEDLQAATRADDQIKREKEEAV